MVVFPPGSILPAERELSELIGVTRTTLREVLQRLARDGWLTIQHGKPTKVNDYMETSGLHILDTLMTLVDANNATSIVEDLLAARTNISCIFIRQASKLKAEIKEDNEKDPAKREEILIAKTFNYYDYMLFQGVAFKSGNQIYGLIFNGLKKLYARVGSYYFSNPEARELALQFYRDLKQICEEERKDAVMPRMRQYGLEGNLIWNEMKLNLPSNFREDDR
ncbi:UNVERIFIED_CONTAM: hypothetical protein GTU68_024250 [Idotea baltica]|nr:hypothetical protein [Idotea baltica]